jgi:peptidoglycan hydrolase-like protein with peptidoglycan-binding domain
MRAILPAALLASLALALPALASTQGSPDVAALQARLTSLGLYAGDVDGWAGPQTQAALRRLPGASTPLAADTRAALGPFGDHLLGSRPLTAGCSGWDVAALQFLLAWHGFPSGTIDGAFGDRTTAALLRFQQWAGIDPIGIAGPQTLAALRDPPAASPIALGRPISALGTDGFGPRGARFHTGIDYPAPLGTAVVAAGDGSVVSAGAVAGYGNLVVLAHGSGVTSWYAHLSRILVTPGQRVARGAVVGLVGATGDATGPHLHFEVRVRDAAVDPATALG